MGRWLKAADVDNGSYVCVLNEAAATDLIGYEDCVGQTLILNNVEFTVVGVLKENDEALTSVLTAGTKTAYIPWSTLIRLTDSAADKVTSFYVSAPAGSDLQTTGERLEELLLERFD